MSTLKSNNGFTLIELVITITLTSLLMVILTGGLKLGISSWEKGEKSIKIYQKIRSVLQRVNYDISSIVLFYYKTDGILPTRYLAFSGKQNKFSFITATKGLNPDPKTGSGLKEITYYLDMNSFDQPCLVRKETYLHPDKVFKSVDSLNVCIIKNVASLKMKYHKTYKTLLGKIKDGGWSSNLENILYREERSGDSNILQIVPSGVEISISLLEIDNNDEEKKIILPPLVIPINSGFESIKELPIF